MAKTEAKIRVAVIEDESGPREAILGQITHLFSEELELPEGAVGVDVQSGIEVIRKFQPELVFLDIQLGSSTAFELLAELNKDPLPLNFYVLITTAYSDLGKEIINAAPTRNIGYLSKPIDPYELEDKIKWFQEHRATLFEGRPEPTPVHLITTRKGVLRIPLPDLVRFQSFPNAGRRVFYYHHLFDRAEGEKVQYESAEEPQTLNELCNALPDYFHMVNQQEIVNLRHVKRIDFRQKREVERQGTLQTITVDLIRLSSGDDVALARARKDAFLKKYRNLSA